MPVILGPSTLQMAVPRGPPVRAILEPHCLFSVYIISWPTFVAYVCRLLTTLNSRPWRTKHS